MTGQGLQGTIQLAAVGRFQRADINATANGAQIPGANPILIQRGIVQASVILYDDAPHIVGDAQLAGVRANNFFLARARAKVDYRGGNGLAQVFAEGTRDCRSGRVKAALSPNRSGRRSGPGSQLHPARPAGQTARSRAAAAAPTDSYCRRATSSWPALRTRRNGRQSRLTISHPILTFLARNGSAAGPQNIAFARGAGLLPSRRRPVTIAGFPPPDRGALAAVDLACRQLRRRGTSPEFPGTPRSSPAHLRLQPVVPGAGPGPPGCSQRRSPAESAITARLRCCGR